ncbi:MAG: Gfo/Idh/MocA family oxidoreductase [Spirochaetia bacterium]|nr:Gfo/Idh/MocA family oxidoreductase [Spirochaetia bacterium]
MKLAIIGLGSRMGNMLKEFYKYIPDLKVVGVLDPDREKSKEKLQEKDRADVKYYETVSEMISGCKPDAISIGTRCHLHTPYAIEVSKTGLPLFLEKPVSHSMEQAITLEKAFAKSKSQVVVSFPLRASTLYAEAKRLLRSGAVGKIEHVLATNYVTYGDVYFWNWYRDFSITQGLFLQKATHDLDYIMDAVGAPIVRVAAMASKGRIYTDASLREKYGNDPDREFHEKIGTPESGMNEDSSSALLEFANGAKGVYTQVFFVRRKAHARGATFAGYQGTVSFDWYKGSIEKFSHHKPFVETIRGEEGEGHFGGDKVLIENFRDLAQGKGKSVSGIREGLQSVYACLAAKESAEKGVFVNVKQLDE